MSATPLLLDTCAVIWAFTGTELTAEAQEKLAEAAEEDVLFLSPISAWEIGMLVAKDRLALSIPLSDWIETAFHHPSVQIAELEPALLAQSSFLPGPPHGDPADRILIATARAKRLTLLTRDKQILRYAKEGHLAAAAC